MKITKKRYNQLIDFEQDKITLEKILNEIRIITECPDRESIIDHVNAVLNSL